MNLHSVLVGVEIGLAAVTFVALMFITAPYGRHVGAGWGPTLSNRTGWILMEAPAVLAFLAFYLMGDHRFEAVPLVMLGIWQIHYVNRTFVFPFRLRSRKRMPWVIPLTAIAFNVLNAYVNARWISHLGTYGIDWFTDPRFMAGAAIFAIGLAINWHSDHVLLHLRKPGETGYKVPEGGMYRYVSCPNYFGEILEWAGWALLTWSWAGFAFLLYTMANLVPRALQNHRWYLDKFDDYPPRKAVIPGLL